MKIHHLFFALALLLAACKNTPVYDETSFIELKKDPCFGTCPVYEFRVDGKGNAVFTGKSFTSKEGAWRRTLTPEETATLFQAFEASNFFDAFKDEYTEAVTDLPTTYVTFSHGGKSKTIKDYYGAPEALKNLEKQVELIAESNEGWTQVETSEPVKQDTTQQDTSLQVRERQ